MRGKTISDADRARANRMTMNESGRTISDADRARVSELTKSLNKNDGGMAKKTRVF